MQSITEGPGISHTPTDSLEEIEHFAVQLAWRAGKILSNKFGFDLAIEYKDDRKFDPVTRIDRECQELIRCCVAERFPSHGFIGEEDRPDEQRASPDFLWVVDPLDGTKNYVNGLPIFACSIGVLYQGAPVVAATYIPWPACSGLVMHARKGNGTFVGENPAAVFKGARPEHFKLSTLPGSFRTAFSVAEKMSNTTGEARNTGSMAYDLALTANGVLQYTVMTSPRIWDVAAGALLVTEAGGTVLIGRHASRLRYLLLGRLKWTPLEKFIPRWESGHTRISEVWSWSHNLVAGGPGTAGFVSSSLRRKSPLTRRVARFFERGKKG